MVEKTSYVCEICNGEYQTEEGAINCEESHKIDLLVGDVKYHPHKQFPYQVDLVATDGTRKTYVPANSIDS